MKTNLSIVTILIFLTTYSELLPAQAITNVFSCSVEVKSRFKSGYGTLDETNEISIIYEFTVPKDKNSANIFIPLENYTNSVEATMNGETITKNGKISFIQFRDNGGDAIGFHDGISIQTGQNFKGEIGGIEQFTRFHSNVGGLQLRTNDTTVLSSNDFVTDSAVWNGLISNRSNSGAFLVNANNNRKPLEIALKNTSITVSCVDQSEKGCQSLPVGVGRTLVDEKIQTGNVVNQICGYEIAANTDSNDLYEVSAKCPDQTTYIGGGYEADISKDDYEKFRIQKNIPHYSNDMKWKHTFSFSKEQTQATMNLDLGVFCAN